LSLPPEVFDEGNLSALEDMEPIANETLARGVAPRAQPLPHIVQPVIMSSAPPRGFSSRVPPGAPSSGQAVVMPSPPPAASALTALAESASPASRKASNAKLGVVVVVAAAAAAAAAWFTHLIPHP
jgi:hypothetical protein